MFTTTNPNHLAAMLRGDPDTAPPAAPTHRGGLPLARAAWERRQASLEAERLAEEQAALERATTPSAALAEPDTPVVKTEE